MFLLAKSTATTTEDPTDTIPPDNADYLKKMQDAVTPLSSDVVFRKRVFTFNDEFLNLPVTVKYLMADPETLCDYFIQKAIKSASKSGGFPQRSTDTANQWGEFFTADQWWEDLDLLRQVFRLPDLQSLPFVVFIDGTNVTEFGRSLVPIYACSALDSFEERNADKKLIGFFPEAAIEAYINTKNTSSQAIVRRRFRSAFFNNFLGFR
jgi:hypothetical protein